MDSNQTFAMPPVSQNPLSGVGQGGASQNQPIQPTISAGPDGKPMIQQVQVVPPKKKDVAGLVKTIVIIALSLVVVTFVGLFIWKTMQYDELDENVQSIIDKEVAGAKDEQFKKDEQEFFEREKYPFKTFAGPIDYGQLSFEYPKTWSVYVDKPANAGGDFSAYFNPVQVDTVAKDTINALRVSIQNTSFEEVTQKYQKDMDKKDSGLTMEATTFNGISGNRYTGKIPGTDLEGFIVTFKIRDKTAILQTDSKLFEEDFNKLLETVTFNE